MLLINKPWTKFQARALLNGIGLHVAFSNLFQILIMNVCAKALTYMGTHTHKYIIFPFYIMYYSGLCFDTACFQFSESLLLI